jgi:hypothetical protein
LFDISQDTNIEENEYLIKDFYNMMNFERDVNAEFKKIFNIIQNSLRNKDVIRSYKDINVCGENIKYKMFYFFFRLLKNYLNFLKILIKI